MMLPGMVAVVSPERLDWQGLFSLESKRLRVGL